MKKLLLLLPLALAFTVPGLAQQSGTGTIHEHWPNNRLVYPYWFIPNLNVEPENWSALTNAGFLQYNISWSASNMGVISTSGMHVSGAAGGFNYIISGANIAPNGSGAFALSFGWTNATAGTNGSVVYYAFANMSGFLFDASGNLVDGNYSVVASRDSIESAIQNGTINNFAQSLGANGAAIAANMQSIHMQFPGGNITIRDPLGGALLSFNVSWQGNRATLTGVTGITISGYTYTATLSNLTNGEASLTITWKGPGNESGTDVYYVNLNEPNVMYNSRGDQVDRNNPKNVLKTKAQLDAEKAAAKAAQQMGNGAYAVGGIVYRGDGAGAGSGMFWAYSWYDGTISYGKIGQMTVLQMFDTTKPPPPPPKPPDPPKPPVKTNGE